MLQQLKNGVVKYLVVGLTWTLVLFAWLLFIAFWFSWIVFPYMILAYVFIPLIILLFVKVRSMLFLSYASGDVIIFGPRGAGKGLVFHYMILKENQRPLSNIDFGYNDVVPPFVFYESIRPNNARAMINNTLTIVKKIHEFEGRPYYFDDTNGYAPNIEDAYLKKYYTAMSLLILLQRHAYNSRTVMNAQSLERMYKNLRELQQDGYVKAMSMRGWGIIWTKLPILRRFARVSVRYYSQYDTALKGRLPFEKLGILNTASDGFYTTTPSALKKMYQAEHGVIKDFALWIKKKDLRYDTREYHKHLFGEVSPTTKKAWVNQIKAIQIGKEEDEKDSSKV